MRFAVRTALRTVALALTALGVVTASAAASPTSSPVVGHVYVNDDTATVNTVAAFDRHADGTLTPVPGSPFAAGGQGTGTAIASQGSLQQSADHRYLLAVDAGSDQVSVLRILPGGGLTPVAGGPVSSGGSDPVSIAVSGHLVYVANAGFGGENYTGFRLGGGGRLQPIAGSTFALPAGSQPGDVLFGGYGRLLAGTRVATDQIDSFAVSRSGRLTPAAGSPLDSQGHGPFGSEFRPTNPWQLFVSNAHGGTGNGTVSAFQVSGDGTLSSIGDSPFPDLQTAPCWVEISHDGRHLFAVNTASGTISTYDIAWGGSLTLAGSTPLSHAAGPEDARLSPDGRSLWVVNSGDDAINAFLVKGGTLTELASSPTPLPAGATPAGVVVN
jgi:6-phosphogluconolactonase (cycloisomerase 2 family)